MAQSSNSTTKTKTQNTTSQLPPELQEDKGTPIGRTVINIIHGFALVAITLLTFRFVMLLAGASTTSSFVRFIYRTSDAVMAPFRGIFPPQVSEDGVHYLDFSALFAIVVYALLAWWMASMIRKWERKDKLEEWKAQQEMLQNRTTTTTTTTRKTN